MDIGAGSETLLQHPRRPSLDDASTRPRGPPQDGIGNGAGNLEPDTCRICRGEATPQEPLFYPCKCSGSIKYVHQDCLMEWLSHSQKKHCELCKTSFRFTKLYSPTMPKQLPLFVFLRHLAKYFARNILVWLRVVLVFSVWMVFLPVLTRWEWSFFFWVSEEGLVAPQQVVAAAASAASAAAAANTATTPSLASTLAASAATSAAVQLDPAAQGLYEANTTARDTVFSVALRVLLDMAGVSDGASLMAQANNSTAGLPPFGVGQPTLLGEVAFLRNLTRYRTLNRVVIYALEGEFVTFLVIICFILIILVRDYVVQQQPEINMRAAFAAAEEAGVDAGEGVPGAQAGQPLGGGVGAGGGAAGDWMRDVDDSDWETDSNSDHHDGEFPPPPLANNIYRLDDDPAPPVPDTDGPDAYSVPSLASSLSPTRASSPTLATAARPTGRDEAGESSAAGAAAATTTTTTGEAGRPAVPNFDRNFPLPIEGGASVNEYMRVYRRAGGDPRRILEIAREENLEESLKYWLHLMQTVVERRQSDRGSTASTVSTAAADATEPRDETTSDAAPHEETTRTADSAGSRRHWSSVALESNVDLQNTINFLSSSSGSKGKERADEPGEPDEGDKDEAGEASSSRSAAEEFGEFEYGLRPRANTDGPAPTRINPLANNNWSFPAGTDAQTTGFAASSQANQPAYQFPGPGDITADTWRQLRRLTPVQDQPELPASSGGRGGMADIAEEADDSTTPPHSNPQIDSSTDASAAAPTPSSTASSRVDSSEAAGAGEPGTSAGTNNGPDDARNGAAAAAAVNPPNDAQQQPQPEPPAGFLGALANFMWRDLDNIDPADLPPIPEEPDDDGHAALFNNRDEPPVPLDELDREALEAAAAAAAAANIANMEAEAIEDAEDLEGVMELLGMRGPITGLFQNAIFCAFLVTVSLLIGIFLPYNVGRLSIWLLANPMRPVMMLFSLSKLLQDAAAVVLGGCAFVSLHALRAAASLVELAGGWTVTAPDFLAASLATTWDLFATAAVRVIDNFHLEPPFLSTGEIRNFSAISHEALLALKGHAAAAGRAAAMVATGDVFTTGGASDALGLAARGAGAAWALLRALPAVLSNPGSWVITLEDSSSLGAAAGAVSPALAYWDGGDRSLAILLGYSTMCLVAGLYLHRGVPFSSGQTGQDWEASLIDGLNQASGVLKVILIIGIEMLVFPLYCGLLLDVALLPLFEDTTLKSRLYFSLNYPLTSIFVHWFVGTGYMFHFALFVSMCRKIMRKGVLYFIRDPDDPEFHPVRDVLERSVTTQLRKILFSAFVYGALVIICLGGVVWGLAYAGPGVLPIHYSSNEPVLEFPIDLLFYNFLMPLAIKFFKPSDGLHAMYTWWFRKSARILRITWFLFGERKIDEEGVLALSRHSPYQRLPWLSRQFLQYDADEEEVAPWVLRAPPGAEASRARTAAAVAGLQGGAGGVHDTHTHTHAHAKMTKEGIKRDSDKKRRLVALGFLIPDGRFVRAPASDQVKIPKGKTVFLDVVEPHLRPGPSPGAIDPTALDEFDDWMLDGPSSSSSSDDGDDAAAGAAANNAGAGAGAASDLYASDQYELVYIPPHFWTRIFLFIAFIWLFAAVTGVSFTIIPLLFGRRLFQVLLPDGVRTNDIYAFSIGIYVLGSAAYVLLRVRPLVAAAVGAARRTLTAASARSALAAAGRIAARAAALAYAYFFILVVFPLLSTALVELYVLIPLHTYMYPPGSADAPSSAAAGADNARHTVRIIQSWTLGLLYLKVGTRTVASWYPEARLASAVRAVLRRGHLDPDVRLLTRAFVVPGLVLGAAAVGLPLALARLYAAAPKSLLVSTFVSAAGAPAATAAADTAAAAASAAAPDLRLVYRLAFPFVAVVGAAAWSLWGMVGVYGSWKVRIRDEAYLIGERLHNFGATSAPQQAAAARRALRAGVGGRL